MESNARSVVRRIQAEMSFIFIFPTVVSRTALSIWQRFRRRIFCGKTFGFSAQTIASVACHKKRRENAAASDFVDKSCEERRPRLNESAFVNFITPSDLLHTSDRLINSRRFIDGSSRKSESLIDAIIIACVEKLGTASTCLERQ